MPNFDLHADNQFTSPAEAARLYVKLGWEPLVLPAREKSPKHKWGTPVAWTDDEIPRKFSPTSNVGIALGSRSGGLIDIDFDWAEAAWIGRELLTDLPSFGRPGSPYSHRLAIGQIRKSVRYQIPPAASALFDSDRMTVLELRGDGLQTMVPPSVHPSGELVRWHDDPATVLIVDSDDLERRAGCVAFLAVIVNKYPRVAGNRDNVCLALTGALVRAGFSDEETDHWVTMVAELAGDEEADKRGGKSAATRDKLEADEETWGLPMLCEFLGIQPMESTLRKWLGGSHDDGDGGNAITIRPGFLPQVVDAAEQALLREGIGIYQRFDSLVRVVRLTVRVDEEGVGRDSGALILKPVTAPWLREQFARVARWVRPGKKGATRADPPQDAATAYLARVGEWKLRFLQGITQSPTMRADGTILQEPGYDPASGLLYDPGHVIFPLIADAPTQEQARAALDILASPFRAFSFADEADRSVALAAVLTALVRAMFPSAPLFAVDAPTAGTGKSLLT